MTATAQRAATAEPTPPARPSAPVKLRHGEQEEKRFARKLVAPALVLVIVVTQVPFLVTIYFSFQNWNLSRPTERSFAGFDNYAAVFANGYFGPSLLAHLIIVGSSVALSLILGLLLAMLLNREFVGRSVARTLLITPFLIMPAAAALIWKWSMLNSDGGIVNWALGGIGLPEPAWNTDFPVLTIIAVLTWQYTPFMMLILLAGLQSQSGEVLEAAQVDGASSVRIFFSMTIPHLRTYAELAVLLGVILMGQVFDPVNIMTKGAGNTKTIPYLLYERAFIGQQVGEAAAYGVITVIITIILATIALRTVFTVFSNKEASR